jgi:mannosyltransferase OCH1-like enzyme
MIPQIIHNIWLQGYDDLSNTIKLQYSKIKKKNPDWEFIIWDNNMIEKLLKKYPKIYDRYKNSANYDSINQNLIKSDIARYIIMKEYGGLYYDIEYTCNNSLNSLFDNKSNKNIIYITVERNNFLDFINLFNRTKYSSSFMAMNANHPIWEKVIEKLIFATTQQQIKMALDISLQEIEISNNTYPITILTNINGYYECKNKETICYMKDDFTKNPFRIILKYITCHYKQIILLLLSIIIIIIVEKIYSFNVLRFGAVNFIPGMPPPVNSQSHTPQHNTDTKNKKQSRKRK